MDKRRTPESMLAHSIFGAISKEAENLKGSFRISFDVRGYNEKLVRETLRKLMRDKKEFKAVSTFLKPGVILVTSKGHDNTLLFEKMAEMVKRLMLHVDDENLYDEARQLLEEHYGA